MTSLILRCETGGIQIIKNLLECIHVPSTQQHDPVKLEIKEKSKEMLSKYCFT